MTAASRPSSAWVKALVVVVLGAAAVAVGLDAFGSDDTAEPERRAAVRQYIVAVNTTQQTFALELERVSVAYRKLKLTAAPPAGERERVAAAEQTLERLNAKLAGISAPPEATKLRNRLLRLGELQIAFAHEVTEMLRYLPEQAAAGRLVLDATKRLQRTLDGAGTGEAQLVAFTDYRRSVLSAAAALDRAAPPAVLAPGRDRQARTFRRLASLSGRIERAFAAKDTDAVNRLFALFAAESGATGTTPAERRAVIAFNAQLAAIVDQRAAVDAERRRLSAALD